MKSRNQFLIKKGIDSTKEYLARKKEVPSSTSTTYHLKISCRNLMNPATNQPPKNVICISYPLIPGKNEVEVELFDCTDVVTENTNSPKFPRTINLPYEFQKVKQVRFDIYDLKNPTFLDKKINEEEDVLCGRMFFHLDEVVGTVGQMVKKRLSLPGGHETSSKQSEIVISVDDTQERLDTRNARVCFKFRGYNLKKMDLFGLSDPYYILKKIVSDGDNKEFCRSEIIKYDLNPEWEKSERYIRIEEINEKCTYHDPFLFECWDWDKTTSDDFIGFTKMTVDEVKSGKTFDLKIEGKDEVRGTITGEVLEYRDWTFRDYLNSSEVSINMIAAIDFSSSNRTPSDPSSLHYLNEADPNHRNDYEKAIRSVCEILCLYGESQYVPVYGFGAKLVSDEGEESNVSDCFAMNGNEEFPYCYGVEGVLSAYRHRLKTIELIGHNNLEEVMKKANWHAKMNKNGNAGIGKRSLQYHILVIFSKNTSINDRDRAIEQVVAASGMNMSVVYVGIGNSNFVDVARTFIPENRPFLKVLAGDTAKRDVFHVSSAKSSEDEGKEVCEDALSWIPSQFMEYILKIEKMKQPPLDEQRKYVSLNEILLISKTEARKELEKLAAAAWESNLVKLKKMEGYLSVILKEKKKRRDERMKESLRQEEEGEDSNTNNMKEEEGEGEGEKKMMAVTTAMVKMVYYKQNEILNPSSEARKNNYRKMVYLGSPHHKLIGATGIRRNRLEVVYPHSKSDDCLTPLEEQGLEVHAGEVNGICIWDKHTVLTVSAKLIVSVQLFFEFPLLRASKQFHYIVEGEDRRRNFSNVVKVNDDNFAVLNPGGKLPEILVFDYHKEEIVRRYRHGEWLRVFRIFEHAYSDKLVIFSCQPKKRDCKHALLALDCSNGQADEEHSMSCFSELNDHIWCCHITRNSKQEEILVCGGVRGRLYFIDPKKGKLREYEDLGNGFSLFACEKKKKDRNYLFFVGCGDGSVTKGSFIVYEFDPEVLSTKVLVGPVLINDKVTTSDYQKSFAGLALIKRRGDEYFKFLSTDYNDSFSIFEVWLPDQVELFSEF